LTGIHTTGHLTPRHRLERQPSASRLLAEPVAGQELTTLLLRGAYALFALFLQTHQVSKNLVEALPLAYEGCQEFYPSTPIVESVDSPGMGEL